MKMSLLDEIKLRAKEHLKTIILPETMDRRVLKAARMATDEEIAEIILLGNKENIIKDNNDINLNDIRFIDPENDSLLDKYVDMLYNLRKEKGMTLEEARRLLTTDYMYFACMLVYDNMADGVVSGACHSTANTLRPSLQIIKTKKDVDIVSAFFLMIVPDCEYGADGVFVFGDSGLVQDPTSEELVSIAYSSAKSFELLTGKEAKVAFLSHSTKGSAKHALVDKVVKAYELTKSKYPDLKCDGELQLDAAIVPEVQKSKAPDSEIKAGANTLIFPNLDAGNIGYKLVQRLAKAQAYGPITQGINKPINDLSRGCSSDDIVGVIAITAVQSTDEK